MKKKIISVLTVLAIIVGMVPLGIIPVFAASSGTAVASTPAVRSSVTKSGTFTLTSAARLFIVSDSDPTGSDLGTYVKTASSVLAAKKIPTSSPFAIVYGKESAAQAGDIVIKIDSSATGHKGGYVLDISADGISITADDAEGVLYALTTLTQTCVSGITLTCTTVTDWPDVAERSVYLDCGRIYFAPATLKALIRTMAWNKMNVLYLDFSNNNATRFLLDDMDVTVGGKTYDITTAAPSDGYLTQSDMDGIIDEANRYGVQIIPTFNSPGHIGGIRSVNTSFFKSASASDYDSGTGKVALNILDSTAYAFGQAVVKLYVDYFASKGCRSFNIAADEVTDAISGLNSTNSTFVSYVNDLNTYIKSKGMTTRMFNDGYKSTSAGISRDIVILYWTTESVNAQALIDAGHPVVNLNCHAGLYYAYCSGVSSAYVWNQDVDKIYAGWNPGVTSCKVYSWSSSSYAYTPQEWVSDYKNEEKFLGAAFAIWTDFAFNRGKNGTTIFAENYKNMMQKIYTVAERSWSTSCTDSYSTWSGKLKAAPGGLTMSGSVDGTALPSANDITQAVGYEYEIGAFAVTATRRTMTVITLSWTAPSAEKAVTYTVKKTVSGKTTVLAENTTSLSLDDNNARIDAVYTVIASMTENGVDLAQPVSVSVTSAGGGLPAFVQGSVATVSVGGDISYVLDTDGIEEGTYVMVIYNTNNESSSNYYAVSSNMKNSTPYGLVTTKVTQYVDTSANTVDISSLDSDSYLWNITVSGGKYYITAANGNGTLSINGQNNVNLTGSNTALTLKTGSRTGAYYVNYSGTNGYRLDMYSDRSGYTPSNGQCLLSSWDSSGSQNHNNVYFYRLTGSASDVYKADNSSLLELIAFAEGIDSSLYSNWDALSTDSLIAAAKAASSVSEYSAIADAEAEQKAINDAGQALYDALLKLGTEMIYYGIVTVKYVDDAGLVLRSETVMRGEEGTAYTIIPETISGYLTPSSVSGVYGKNTNEEITLVYTLNTDKSALKTELDNVVEQGDYTDESYSAYTSALEAAREVYNNSRALQSEVDSALSAVVNAKANLKVQIFYGTVTVKYVDDAGVTIKSTKTLTGEAGTVYTIVPETISGYITPSSVSGVYGKNTNEEITLVYTLNTDKTALKNELDNVVEQGDYTDESYSAYTSALEAAREVYNNSRALQSEVDSALSAVVNAKANLKVQVFYGTVTVKYVDDMGVTLRTTKVLTGEAGTAYTIVPETISGYLTPSSVSGVYGKNTNEEITLVYTLNTDKSTLKNELDNVVEQGDYTDESYSAYISALEAAREVYNNSRALQSEVDSALGAVVNAKANLKSALVVVSPKSIAASSNREFYQSYTSSLALDGSTSTYAWIANAQRTGDWFKVTFDDVYTISDVTITSSYGSDYIRSADIQVSVNGSDWTTVGTYSGSGTKTISFGRFVDAKYVRICLTSSSDYWWVVNEISFTFGPESEYAGQVPVSPVYRLDSDGTINSGSEYIIKASGSDYALAVSGGTLTSVKVSPEDNAVSIDNDYAVWIITKSGSGYTIQNKGSGQYLKLTVSGGWYWSSGATLSLSSSATVFTASYGSSYTFRYSSGRRYYYLGFSGTTPTATTSSSYAGFLLYLADN